MSYWWVNHKKTYRQEIDGGYLWSPKHEANGARSEFYDNMVRLKPDDFILSYANGKIDQLGTILDVAASIPKPESFAKQGEYWSKIGWGVPVSWRPFKKPIHLKDFLDDLRPLLPRKYSPITRTGIGNRKAYLTEISPEIFDLIRKRAELAPAKFARPLQARAGENFLNSIDNKIENEIRGDSSLSNTVKLQLIQARYGQGKFRSNVLKIGATCRVTCVDNPHLLIASHIKPWRLCKSAEERLSGYNGLMLTPHVDRLFDRGFISFSNRGQVLISPDLDPADLERMGLADLTNFKVGPFLREQSKYLKFHREKIFIKTSPRTGKSV